METRPAESNPEVLWPVRAAEARPPRARNISDLRARLEVAWAGAQDGLWDWDLEGGEMRFSRRFKELLGCRDTEIEPHPEEWFRRVHPDELRDLKTALYAFLDDSQRSPELVFEHEFRLLHKDGSWRRMRCRAMRHATEALIGGSFTDLSAVESAQQRLIHEAFHDPLTELPNRQLFIDRLSLSISRSRRRGHPELAVLYLDLDRFRTVNDSLGPDAGDELLLEVTRRIDGLVRPGDTFARLGGDKFAVLLDGVKSHREAAAFAESLAEALTRPLVIQGHEIFPSASTGIAVSTPATARAEDFLNDAVTAMHRAKEDGATRYELFDPEMSSKAKGRLRLEADLRRALSRGEFLLYYQPIISFETGKLSSFEALLRWRHPERGLVGPDQFIPIAEENGMILQVGAFVLEEACKQMKRWLKRFPHEEVAVAVNLSARQFEDPGLVADVDRTLENTGLDPARLKLEMTESVVMARTRENAAKLQALRERGVQLLIDDFGTGYSSLASLHAFPLDSIKIDRSFVSRMEHEEEKREIVRTILTLARNLGMDVVAEGIETAEQLRMLRELSCDYGQGYFFSNAVDGESASAWLKTGPRF